jgi:transposase
VSKLKTSTYLLRHKNIEVPVQQIYRYMDKLHSTQKQEVEAMSYQHTLKVLNNQISVVFYEVTTLYFEIDNEDELRKTCFSKEGKHQNPQIVLGLLVGTEGYPLAYDLFEGNKFEGYTMLPILDSFRERYSLDKLVVIADSGLLSSGNVEELIRRGYAFILGARIKSEPEAIKQKILAMNCKTDKVRLLKGGN